MVVTSYIIKNYNRSRIYSSSQIRSYYNHSFSLISLETYNDRYLVRVALQPIDDLTTLTRLQEKLQ